MLSTSILHVQTIYISLYIYNELSCNKKNENIIIKKLWKCSLFGSFTKSKSTYINCVQKAKNNTKHIILL